MKKGDYIIAREIEEMYSSDFQIKKSNSIKGIVEDFRMRAMSVSLFGKKTKLVPDTVKINNIWYHVDLHPWGIVIDKIIEE